MDPVRNMSDRYFFLRPPRNERRKEMPAHFPVQLAHPIDRPAPSHGKVSHIEGFKRVVRVLAAKRHEIVERDAELVPGVRTEVLVDKDRSEPVKADGHPGVRGKEVARPRDGQRDFEGLPGLSHKGSSAFQYGESGMPFIQMTDLGLDAERGE